MPGHQDTAPVVDAPVVDPELDRRRFPLDLLSWIAKYRIGMAQTLKPEIRRDVRQFLTQFFRLFSALASSLPIGRGEHATTAWHYTAAALPISRTGSVRKTLRVSVAGGPPDRGPL
jgi:hypothetical protein